MSSFALQYLVKSAISRGEARAIAKQFPSMPHQWSDLDTSQKKDLRVDLRRVLKKYPTVHTGDIDRLARYGVRVAGPTFGMGLIDPTGILMGGTAAWQMKRREQLKNLLRQELKGRKVTEE